MNCSELRLVKCCIISIAENDFQIELLWAPFEIWAEALGSKVAEATGLRNWTRGLHTFQKVHHSIASRHHPARQRHIFLKTFPFEEGRMLS